MQYKVHFSPSNYYYTFSSENPLTPSQFFSQHPKNIEEFPTDYLRVVDLSVVLDDDVVCPTKDLTNIVPTVQRSSSRSTVLSFDGHALLELSPLRENQLRIHPDLGKIAPTMQQSAALIALRHGAAKSGRAILHASAVETANRGLVLLGDTRAGKSTFSVMASLSNSCLLSDDLILIEFDEASDRPLGYAARQNFTLRKDIAESCTQLPLEQLKKISTAEGTKYVIPRESGLVRTVSSMGLDHMLFCKGFSGGGTTEIKKLNKAEYYALLLENFFPMFGENFRIFKQEQESTLELVSVLHNKCNGYAIEIGTDILKSPELTMNNLIHQMS